MAFSKYWRIDCDRCPAKAEEAFSSHGARASANELGFVARKLDGRRTWLCKACEAERVARAKTPRYERVVPA